MFTHDEYIGLVLRSGQFMTHDYSHQSTKEDPRMMAFFDSLVQREIEGWSSEDMPTPRTPSDSEINPATGEPYSATDFDGTASRVSYIFEKISNTSYVTRGMMGNEPSVIFAKRIISDGKTIFKFHL